MQAQKQTTTASENWVCDVASPNDIEANQYTLLDTPTPTPQKASCLRSHPILWALAALGAIVGLVFLIHPGATTEQTSANDAVYTAPVYHVPNPIANQYIVMLRQDVQMRGQATDQSRDEISPLTLVSHLTRLEKQVAGLPRFRSASGDAAPAFKVTHEYTHLPGLLGYSVTLSEAALELVMHDPSVEYVEEDAIMTAYDPDEEEEEEEPHSPGAYDPDEGEQEPHSPGGEFEDAEPMEIGTEDAPMRRVSCISQSSATWNLAAINAGRGSSSRTFRHPSHGGAGVDIYILDTGIRRTHTDFTGRASWGYDGHSSRPHRTDIHGHGTHVASSAGGHRWGVAKRANLIDVRVLGDDNRGSSSGYLAGMDWAAARTRRSGRTSIMNASLRFRSGSRTVDRATAAAGQVALVVVASGNDNANSCEVSPARSQGVLSVGNAQSNNVARESSNWGACTHIFAPGTSIRAASARHSDDTSSRSSSGTSMAAPHVAGVAALLLAENPNDTPARLRRRVLDNARSGSMSSTNLRGTVNLYARYSGCN